jgi:cobalamin-dependent methionine synthase I
MLQIIPQSEFSGFKVPPHEVWRYLGYIEESKARPEIREIFKRVIEEVGPLLLEPAACYDIFPIKNVTSSSVEVDGVFFDSQDFALRQNKTKEIALFIVTVGAGVGEKAEELIVGADSVLGYMLDVYASAAVDTLAYRVREIIEDSVRSRGYKAIKHGVCLGKKCPAYRDCGGVVINWWSPGYGDWSALENKKIFSIVDANQIGVRVKESGMMEPRKSYACTMPLGPEGEKPLQKCVEWKREWIQRGQKAR